MNTGAIYGFALILFKILKELKPDYIGVVFDSKEPTFRHKRYKDYKATREKMPDEMVDQIPYIEKLVKAMSLPYIIMPTYEADDIIGTMALKHASKDILVCLVSGDKDLTQLIGDNVKTFTPKKGGEMEILDGEGVEKKFGVPPSRIIDLLSLMGDSSDNIPGVPGIGEKTALKLLREFGSLDNVLASPDKIEQKKLSQSVKENRELALLSRELTTIDTNVPIMLSLENLKPGIPMKNPLRNHFPNWNSSPLWKRSKPHPRMKRERNT